MGRWSRRRVVAAAVMGSLGLSVPRGLLRSLPVWAADWQEPRILAQAANIPPGRLSGNWTAVIENPNDTIAIEGIRVEATFYDPSGVVLRTTTEHLDLLPPFSRSAVEGYHYLEDGQVQGSIEVKITEFGWLAPHLPKVENVRYVPGRDNRPTVQGTFINPFPRLIARMQVVGIVYDSSQSIIASASTTVRNVPAEGRAAVSVSVDSSTLPFASSAELLVRL